MNFTMSSIDSYLTTLGVDVETLVTYTPEELEDLISTKLSTLNPADQATFQEELRAELDELAAELKALEDSTEDVQRDAEREDDYSEMAEAERLLEDLAEIDSTVDELFTALDDAIAHNAFLNVTTDQDYNFTYDKSELDAIEAGETVTITGTGTPSSSGSMFSEAAGDTSGMADTDGDGVADTLIDADGDGVADFDVNLDGFIDYKDMQAANPLVRDPASGQQVFIDINAGDTISLSAYDEATDTATFKITTADGKEFFLKVVGDVNIKFYGSDYMDVSEIATTWPPELAYRCWDGTDMTSFGEHELAPELTDENRLTATAGYSDASASLDSVISTVSGYLATAGEANDDSIVGSITEADKELLQQMIDLLYGTRASDATMTLDEAWTEILTLISSKSQADQSAIMSALILAVGQGDPANLATYFGAYVSQIETLIYWTDYDGDDDTNINSFDKMMLLYIEQKIGPTTKFGGSLVTLAFSADGTTDSEFWKDNAENVQALEWYQDVLAKTGEVAGADILTAYKNEQEMAGGTAEAADHGGATEDQSAAMKKELQALIYSGNSSYWSGANLKETEWKFFLEELIKKLFDSNGKLVSDPVAAMKKVLTAELSDNDFWSNASLEGDDLDNIASALVVALSKECPTAADVLLSNSEVRNYLYNQYDNGYDKPPLYDEANAVMANYTK